MMTMTMMMMMMMKDFSIFFYFFLLGPISRVERKVETYTCPLPRQTLYRHRSGAFRLQKHGISLRWRQALLKFHVSAA